MKPYSRRMFPSRGKLPVKDIYLDEFSVTRRCEICKEPIVRKKRRSGIMEDIGRFKKRRTCGTYYGEDGRIRKTDCLIKILLNEKNPNYRGILPKCKTCGKKLKTYPAKRAKGEHCFPCRVEAQKGIFPEHLKKFSFTVGMIPWNKSV